MENRSRRLLLLRDERLPAGGGRAFPDCTDQCFIGAVDVPATTTDAATTTEEMEVETTEEEAGEEPEEAATTTAAEDVGHSTEASADPFAYLVLATGGLMASPSNGCALHGWHGEYKTYAGAPAMTVDVYPLSTTVTFSENFKDTQSAARLAKWLEDPRPKGYQRFRKIHEIKRKNSELAAKFCATPGWGLAELCSFFSPGGAHLHCAHEAAKKAGVAATKAGAAVKETAATAVNATKDFVKEALKDPLESPSGGNMWRPMESNGCTLTGWSGTYLTLGLLKVLKVEVSPTSTTFNFMVSPGKLENDLAFLNGLNGTHSNEAVADVFCGTAPLLTAFPNACAFWSPGSLSKLCPGLVAGHAVQAAKETLEAAHAAAHAGYKSVKNYFGW